MRLYLVQHGEAVPEEVDPTRPLGERGRADVRQMATFLAQGGVRADRVWHAGKRRAEQTAAVLAAALAPGDAPVARAGLDPGDPTDGVTREAAAWEGDVMLVGHLPFMARLASRLVAGRENARRGRPRAGQRALPRAHRPAALAVGCVVRRSEFTT